MGAALACRPAASASPRTAASSSGWLSRSASPLASRGTGTARHCVARRRAPARSTRIWARGLVAASIAAAAGSQSPMATTACGVRPMPRAAAAATAHAPNSSAAGIDTVGSGDDRPSRCSSALRSARVIADRRSIAPMSAGHHSETSHTVPPSAS
eukprot:5690466-Pleurochrysis_carterae.AAC.1